MKSTIVGTSTIFPDFSIGDYVEVLIKHGIGNIHDITINNVKGLIEITKTIFIDSNSILIEGFLNQDNNLGKIALKFTYENS
jgi:hypothetical protein